MQSYVFSSIFIAFFKMINIYSFEIPGGIDDHNYLSIIIIILII